MGKIIAYSMKPAHTLLPLFYADRSQNQKAEGAKKSDAGIYGF